jgi:orotate phosphoribosyltransferase
VITTGGSAAEVIRIVDDAGARVARVGSLIDRAEREPGFHLEALLKVSAKTWDPSECPMCAAGEPLHTPGSRALSNVPRQGS